MDVRVTQLLTTPVKGFAVREVAELQVTESGAVGNRDFFLIDDRNVLFSVTRCGALLGWWATEREHALLFGVDGETLGEFPVDLGEPVHAHFYDDHFVDARFVIGGVNSFLSELVDHDVRLVKAIRPSGGYDAEPLTVVSRASIDAMGRETDERPLDARRLRLNLTIDGVEPFAEDTWLGREFQLGSARVRIGAPVPRCAAVTRNTATGRVDVDVLRRIRQARGIATGEEGERSLDLGVYASVTAPGTIALGDLFRSLGEIP